MSFNRLDYDTCAYQQYLNESVGVASHIMDTNRFENSRKCRMELGILGGTAVSNIKGNMVDLESDLRNQTRMLSKCPTMKYMSPCPTGDINTCQPRAVVIPETPTTKGRVIDTTPMHLNPCQMIHYKKVPAAPRYVPANTCNLYSNLV